MEKLNFSILIDFYQTKQNNQPNDYQELITQIIKQYNIFLEDFKTLLSLKQYNFIQDTLQTINDNVVFKIDVLYDYLYTIIKEIVDTTDTKTNFNNFIEIYTFQINGYTFLQHYYTIKHIFHSNESKWNIYNVSNLIDECELNKIILSEHYNHKYIQFRQLLKTSLDMHICNDICYIICEYI